MSNASKVTSCEPASPNEAIDRWRVQVNAFCATLAARITGEEMVGAVRGLADLKVFVIGDTIFDRYVYVNVQGLTSKNRIISSRFLHEEMHCGGAAAVFGHVKQFAPQARFLSLLGTEDWVESRLQSVVSPAEDCTVRVPGYTTIVKQRFVEPLIEGAELSKLFSVNFIDPSPPPVAVQKEVEAVIRREIAQADVVLVADFGHGLLQPQIRELIQQSARLLALVCQTNSNNRGFNIISRQYQRADAFAIDEQELALSAGHRPLDFVSELVKLKERLHSRYAWLTRGAVQTIGLDDNCRVCDCPPLERDVVDAIGAGDAFVSVAALAAARGLPIELATFLAQLAGAQAVRIVGNSRSISRDFLVRNAQSLLDSVDVKAVL